MRIPGADEGTKEFDNDVIAADEYRLRIADWKEYTQPPGKWNKTEEERVVFLMEVLHQVDDPEEEVTLKDSDEPLPEDFKVAFFFDPKRTGVWNGKVAKSRKFLWAALQPPTPIEEPFEFDSYDDLIGKEIIGSVVVGKDKNGNDRNNVDSVRPVKKGKKAAAAPTKSELAAKAEAIFAGDVEASTEEDEDY